MKITSKNKRKRMSNKKATLTFIYVLYIVFILVFTLPLFSAKKDVAQASDYTSHLVFPTSGSYGHYKTVELKDENTSGEIKLQYIADTHTLYIQKVTNIKKLVIDCRLMYKNKCKDIFGYNPGKDYYKIFFKKTNKGLFTVSMNMKENIDDLQFLDIPRPKSVLVDNIEWWKTEAGNYSVHRNDITITDIPSGMYVVKIYFQKRHLKNPIAHFTVNKYKAKTNETLIFNASTSKDIDGEIIAYLWDFGDNNGSSGMVTTHSYSDPGIYKVTLTVRDDDSLEDITKKFIIIKEAKDKKCKGIVSMTLLYSGGKGADITLGDGKCKGITSLTLSYTGGKCAKITVNEGKVKNNKNGTYTITPAKCKTTLAANTKIYICNVLHTTIHTSCSKPLDINDVYGDFTVVGVEKIIESKGSVKDNDNGTYTITPAKGKNMLDSNIKIYVNGTLNAEMNISCSIKIGDVYGNFTIVALEKIYYDKETKCWYCKHDCGGWWRWKGC